MQPVPEGLACTGRIGLQGRHRPGLTVDTLALASTIGSRIRRGAWHVSGRWMTSMRQPASAAANW